MILLTALLILLILAAVVLTVGGVGVAVVFGDVIIFVGVLYMIGKLIYKKARS